MAVLAPMPSASVSTATAVKLGFFSNWRKANLRSFITQRLHRIDLGRAACGKPACQDCQEKEQQSDTNEGHRVRRRNAVKQARNKARRRHCTNLADHGTSHVELQTFA